MNSVCPLLSGTGLFESFAGVPDTPENRQKFLGNVPLGRLTETIDIANATLFLSSEEGNFITGVNLEVDGGVDITPPRGKIGVVRKYLDPEGGY